MFVVWLQALKVSCKRSIHRRDKKGRVTRMRSVAVTFSGRKLAASLAATCSAWAGYVGLSGQSGVDGCRCAQIDSQFAAPLPKLVTFTTRSARPSAALWEDGSRTARLTM